MPNSEEVMLTKDQLVKLANIIYPFEEGKLRREWRYDSLFCGVYPHFLVTESNEWQREAFTESFGPDLKGVDRQRLQALDVIVAAWVHCSKIKLYTPYKGNVMRGFLVKQGEKSDILTASIMALLLHGDTAP